MKKSVLVLVLMLAVSLLAGCAAKAASAETGAVEETTKDEYVTYATVVEEGAAGPGGISIVDAYSDYPEDRKPGDQSQSIQVRYFYMTPGGMKWDFDTVEASECTAENMLELLMKNGTLAEGTTVVAYEDDGKGAAVLTLGQLSPGVAEATEEQLAQAIASTFCDNMELDSVTVKAGDKTYGPLKYKE